MYVKGTQLPSDSPCRQALDKACKKDLDKVMQISKDDVRKYEELPGFRFRRYQRVREIPTADFEREVAPGIRTGR